MNTFNYRKDKKRQRKEAAKINNLLLKQWQHGTSLDDLAIKFGFNSRQAVAYRIKQAKKNNQ